MARDAEAIEIIKKCISDGASQKTELLKEVQAQTDLSRRAVGMVLDTYAGTDKARNFWSVRVGARGAKIYSLLTPWIAPVDPDDY